MTKKEITMATIKAFTDISQSKTLSKILPLESADMYFHNRTDIPNNYPLPIEWKLNNPLLSQETPCWSLAALFNLCPTINGKQPILTRGKLIRLWYCYYEDEIDTQTYDNPVDACYEMIIELHEQKLL